MSTLSAADVLLAARCEPPVLDVGCGPGRFVTWLAERGLVALGIDVRPAAVAQTAAGGASVLRRDVQERLPAEGRWGTVLLADDSVRDAGDPGLLLARCHNLLRDGGVALLEVRSPRLVEVAAASGFLAVEEWEVDGRVFLVLRRLG